MEKFKTFTILLSVLSVILLLIVIFGAKHTVYVCYDGTEKEQLKDCPAVPPLVITQKVADAAVTTYANAYARSKTGETASIVNVYRANMSWRSEVLFSNVRTKEVHQVLLNIDGKTSSITCIEGCDYLSNMNADNNSSPGINTTNGEIVVN